MFLKLIQALGLSEKKYLNLRGKLTSCGNRTDCRKCITAANSQTYRHPYECKADAINKIFGYTILLSATINSSARQPSENNLAYILLF